MDSLKTQRARSEIRSLMALVGKRHELANGVLDVFTDAPGGKSIVFSDEFPDVGDIESSSRVQLKTLVAVILDCVA